MWLPAFAIPASLAGDAWTRHLAARLGGSALAAALVAVLPYALPAIQAWTDAGCLMQRLAGLPCPGCGITTSLLALGRADIGAAWHANPAGAGVAVLLVGQTVIAAWGLRAPATPGRDFAWLRRLDRLAIGSLLTVWVGRLVQAAW